MAKTCLTLAAMLMSGSAMAQSLDLATVDWQTAQVTVKDPGGSTFFIYGNPDHCVLRYDGTEQGDFSYAFGPEYGKLFGFAAPPGWTPGSDQIAVFIGSQVRAEEDEKFVAKLGYAILQRDVAEDGATFYSTKVFDWDHARLAASLEMIVAIAGKPEGAGEADYPTLKYPFEAETAGKAARVFQACLDSLGQPASEPADPASASASEKAKDEPLWSRQEGRYYATLSDIDGKVCSATTVNMDNGHTIMLRRDKETGEHSLMLVQSAQGNVEMGSPITLRIGAGQKDEFAAPLEATAVGQTNGLQLVMTPISFAQAQAIQSTPVVTATVGGREVLRMQAPGMTRTMLNLEMARCGLNRSRKPD